MKRQDIVNRWIMMEETELIEECEKFGVPYQKGTFVLNALLNYVEEFFNEKPTPAPKIKQIVDKAVVKSSVLFVKDEAKSLLNDDIPFDELDDISKMAKHAMKFKSNLAQKLQKQEEIERRNAEMKVD
jgi:hypothetical protein